MNIAGRQIGPAAPAFIIAELGVNHDGSPERALALAAAAARAGADAIKLQLFRADLLMSRASRLAAYQAEAGERDPLEMLRRLELPAEAMAPVVAMAHRLGVAAIVTVFSLELIAAAERLPWDAYKTASPDVIHRPMLSALAATGRPLVVSTGAATLDEVTRAVEWLSTPRRESRLSILQCVSSYPTPPERAALGGIASLAAAFPDVPVGYSDHTASEQTGAIAVRLGARVLEKHLTYDRSAQGPDHAASLDPDGLARYVAHVRAAERGEHRTPLPGPGDPTWGPEHKSVLDVERDVRAVSRQSLVAALRLDPGRVLRREDLTIKRPGTGLEPFRLEETIGRRIARTVEADTPLTEADLA
ncbi:MAG: N-acetylneuraminate synthase family protein [Phycisphaerales bacterium]|nr:N-acetylneuraminate synthase family protein [Phycisphaerales bacterium]